MILQKVVDFAIKIKVIESVTGRLRINVPIIKKIPEEYHIKDDTLTSVFLIIKGVTSVEFSYLTGDVIFTYEPEITDKKQILKDVRKMIQIAFSYRKEFDYITEGITIGELKNDIGRMSEIIKHEMSKCVNS
ncbi:hypothetical protein [Oceanirhabdus sp. W0125-5]|uniref:hypothetical protein n=1 Tax=Oceanirhabdus sp. W0125-5 TaxID=2999116 RepID=UPI0022F30668|nr:hypothetical protein [Oceanirhabdus sp. W0125-5]WBW96827.1 hypothetical protein OW730_24525 [Oceanirhabdus sp. W0125-5]